MPTSVSVVIFHNQCVTVLIDTFQEWLRSASHGYLSCPRTKLADTVTIASEYQVLRSEINSLLTYETHLYVYIKTVLFHRAYYV